MPNWCTGILEVRGPKKEVEQFRKFARGINPFTDESSDDTGVEELCLHKFVPVPAKILLHPGGLNVAYQVQNQECEGDDGNKYKGGGGHEWCVENWGTKWGVGHCVVEDASGGIDYLLTTAWTPFGQKVLEAMAQKFRLLNFSYRFAEPGCSFRGKYEAEGGKLTNVFEEEIPESDFNEDGEYLPDDEYADLM
jgi:hypothetical protein